MKGFKLKEILKDKNKVLIIMIVILFVLFLVVILKTKNGSSDTVVSDESNKALLEPVSKEERVLADKLEAYKKDRLAAKKEKMLEADGVKGSDFYFDMQGSDNKYSEKMKARIERMKADPYEQVVDEHGNTNTSANSNFTDKMRNQLNSIEEQQEFEELLRKAKKNVRLQKGMSEDYKFLQSAYDKYLGTPQRDTVFQEIKDDDIVEEVKTEPRFIINEQGRRQRRPQYEIPGKKNLVKAAIYGDQTIVSGTPVKMRLLEPLLISGIEIPANTIFFGTASVGASRMKITVENFRYGTYMSPVSFVIFDNDAIEGLNLPNNMKAESARKMEQGILQGVQLPISSIGTVTSEVTSAITATTQVAKQLLNQSLSQVKVHLKANYQIYLKEETKQDKRKREAEEAELERLFKQIEMQKNEPTKKNPLTSLIESM